MGTTSSPRVELDYLLVGIAVAVATYAALVLAILSVQAIRRKGAAE